MAPRYESFDLRPINREQERKKAIKESVDQAKRTFLKQAAVAGAVVASAGIVEGTNRVKKFLKPVERIIERREEVQRENLNESEKEKNEQTAIESSENEVETEIDSIENASIKNEITCSKETNLTAKKMEGIEKSMYQEIVSSPSLMKTKHNQYTRTGLWQEIIEEANIKYGFDKNFLLAVILVESQGKTNATSPMKAVGYCQFTEKTGREYDLTRGENHDLRRDPELAVDKAGKYFRKLFRIYKDKEVAKRVYNGGQGEKFRQYALANNIEINLDNYLIFMSERINRVRAEVLKMHIYPYQPLSDCILEDIARKFNTDLDKLAKINHIDKRAEVAKKKRIYIPANENTRDAILHDKARGDIENILYGAKINVDQKLIEDIEQKFGKYKGKSAKKLRKIPFKQEKKPQERKHKVAPGDTLYRIAKQYGTSEKEIKRYNRNNQLLQKNILAQGIEIKIPGKNYSLLTLKDMANKMGVNLSELKINNPAILDPTKPIDINFLRV